VRVEEDCSTARRERGGGGAGGIEKEGITTLLGHYPRGAEGSLQPTFRYPTSNTSTPRRTIRRHVEIFDATSNNSTSRRKVRFPTSISSTPHIKQLDATSQLSACESLLLSTEGSVALCQKWLQRRAGGRRTSLNAGRRTTFSASTGPRRPGPPRDRPDPPHGHPAHGLRNLTVPWELLPVFF
jgi:hypothetical protein